MTQCAVLTPSLMAALLAIAGCGDPGIEVWVDNQTSYELVVDFVVPNTIEGGDLHAGRVIPAGGQGVAASLTGPTRARVVVLRSDGCIGLGAIAVEPRTYVVTVAPDLAIEVEGDVDLSWPEGSELEWTDLCLPPPPE